MTKLTYLDTVHVEKIRMDLIDKCGNIPALIEYHSDDDEIYDGINTTTLGSVYVNQYLISISIPYLPREAYQLETFKFDFSDCDNVFIDQFGLYSFGGIQVVPLGHKMQPAFVWHEIWSAEKGYTPLDIDIIEPKNPIVKRLINDYRKNSQS